MLLGRQRSEDPSDSRGVLLREGRREREKMEALSQLFRRRVYDQDLVLIGTLIDVVVLLTNEGTRPSRSRGPVQVTPLVQALLIQRPDGGRLRVSPTQIEQVGLHALFLTSAKHTLPLAEMHPDELALAEEVFDRRIVDLADLRVRRVNEVWFDAQWRLVGVTCSPLSCLSRALPARVAARLSRRAIRSLLPWNQVALFPSADPERAEALPLRFLQEPSRWPPGLQERWQHWYGSSIPMQAVRCSAPCHRRWLRRPSADCLHSSAHAS